MIDDGPTSRSLPNPPPDPTLFEKRARLIRLTRQFFDEHAFLEVETPYLVPYRDLTVHLDDFCTQYRDEQGRRSTLGLITSPEHHMKRLLVAGYERIYQICRFFRNGEVTRKHNPEFTGLEWYQAGADYGDVMQLTEQLLCHIGLRLDGSTSLTYQGCEIELAPPWERLTVREAFGEYAGLCVQDWADEEHLRRECSRISFPISASDNWEDIFFKLFLEKVEPNLGRGRPTWLIDYPAEMAELARVKEDDPTVAERCEFFIAGLELGNGYSELTDPVEQRARFEAKAKLKQEKWGEEFPLDEAFLTALEQGLPSAGGIAIGLDRVAMLFLDQAKIQDVILFPFEQPEQGG